MDLITIDITGGAPDDAGTMLEAYDINSDGRYVAFISGAGDLVAGDTNQTRDVFVRDLRTHVTVRVTVGFRGTGNSGGVGISEGLSISGDGRFVAFTSEVDDMLATPGAEGRDVYVHDLQTGITTFASVDFSGGPTDREVGTRVSISDDGRYVAFDTDAHDLTEVPETDLDHDVFVRDLVAGSTTRVTVDTAGGEPDGTSQSSSISGNGTVVTFISDAVDLVANDNNGVYDAFAHDLTTGVTERISVDLNGGDADGESNTRPMINYDGRYVVFRSAARDLVPDGLSAPPVYDSFRRDRLAGVTRRVRIRADGDLPDDAISASSISDDGRYIAFASSATNIVPGDTNTWSDSFVRDMNSNFVVRVSMGVLGNQANGNGDDPMLSGDGRYVVFRSEATNIIPADRNPAPDLVVRALLPPKVVSVSPRTLPAGSTTEVTVTGVGFTAGARGLVARPARGVSIVNFVGASDTEVRVTLRVDAAAGLGPRHIWFLNPGTGPGTQATAATLCGRCVTVT